VGVRLKRADLDGGRLRGNFPTDGARPADAWACAPITRPTEPGRFEVGGMTRKVNWKPEVLAAAGSNSTRSRSVRRRDDAFRPQTARLPRWRGEEGLNSARISARAKSREELALARIAVYFFRGTGPA